MIALLKHLRRKWDDWCGDHEMEQSIRRHLTDNGYFGGTAKLRGVRLVAVQRPGWQQIYRFDATARVNGRVDSIPPPRSPRSEAETSAGDPDEEKQTGLESPEYHELFGLIREDNRKKISKARVFREESERRSLFTRWSEDMICLRGSYGLLEDKAQKAK